MSCPGSGPWGPASWIVATSLAYSSAPAGCRRCLALVRAARARAGKTAGCAQTLPSLWERRQEIMDTALGRITFVDLRDGPLPFHLW